MCPILSFEDYVDAVAEHFKIDCPTIFLVAFLTFAIDGIAKVSVRVAAYRPTQLTIYSPPAG